MIVFVAPIEAIRQFTNNKITGDELLEKSGSMLAIKIHLQKSEKLKLYWIKVGLK